MGKLLSHYCSWTFINMSLKISSGNIAVCTAGRFEDLCQRKGDKVNLASHLKSLVRRSLISLHFLKFSFLGSFNTG